jgi:sirohydrochlorin cobaltochelatase
MTALLLVAHGSQQSAASSAVGRACAGVLRERGGFDSVSAGFWREEPFLRPALDAIDDAEVVVVPFFMAVGYYTGSVVPRELGLTGRVTRRAGQTIVVTPPVGAHPRMPEIIEERAREAWPRGFDCLALLGHGTSRVAGSRDTTLQHVETLRARGQPQAVAVFLDDEPNVRALFALTAARRISLVPFFVADGYHVGSSVPGDLEMEDGEVRRGERIVRCSRAVGSHPLVVELVGDLARAAAGAPAG